MRQWFFAVAAFLLMLFGGFDPSTAAAQMREKSFASPQEAAKSLFDAAKARDRKAILDILGPAFRDWILSGDPVQDAQRLQRFVANYEQKANITLEGNEKAVLVIGNDDFPFPFPIMKRADGWAFNPDAGKEELLNRRIGRNELNTIQTLLAIVDAQREYAVLNARSGGVAEYARKFRSAPGKKDGLYWPVKEGEPASPLGPLVVGAVREGYRARSEGPIPFHGYYFKILTGQGPQAPGGAYDYVIRRRMIGGFAALAYPARYGISGIMTFAVSHDGVVYETDLGPETAKAAAKIEKFNPDSRWKKVEKGT